MKESQIKGFEFANPTVITVPSESLGLHYIYGEDKNILYVSGRADSYDKNICRMTMQRAREILDYIKEHGSLPHFDGRHFVFGGDQLKNEAVLNEKQAKTFCSEFADMVELRNTITARETA